MSSTASDDDSERTARLRSRLGLRPHGGDAEAPLLGDDDGALLHLATRGDDVVLRGAAGLVTGLELARQRAHGTSSVAGPKGGSSAGAHVGRPLLAWCAGAGGLGEPLSLLLLARAGGLDIDVVASDVAAAACDDARAPELSGQRVATLPRLLARALSPTRRGHAVDPGLLAHLRVARGDLRLHTPAGPFDLVVCREVLHHFRPDVARSMLLRLTESLAGDGVLVLAVVDALTVGLPIDDEGAGVVVVDRHLRAVRCADLSAGRPATWTLCTLLDSDAALQDRSQKLRALVGEVEGAALACAAALLAEGRLIDARAMAAQDDEGGVIRAMCDARLGRLADARTALEGLRARVPSSWVGAWLLGELQVRTGRAAEARGLFRTVLALLEGAGAPAGELVALLPELHPRHVWRSCQQILEGQTNLWHRL